jgi:purine-cytosine permease-like protein
MIETADDRSVAVPRGVEARSIDWVPDSERHGRVWTQGPFWFLGNFQPFTVGIGLVGPGVLGLSLGQTALAGILGILFGTAFMAFHASQGPTFGLPQMVQSRAQFGYRGVILALLATAFTLVGFNVVDTVIIKLGLAGIFGWNPTVVAVGITAIAAVPAPAHTAYVTPSESPRSESEKK